MILNYSAIIRQCTLLYSLYNWIFELHAKIDLLKNEFYWGSLRIDVFLGAIRQFSQGHRFYLYPQISNI